MPDVTLSVGDTLYEELRGRAEKREITLEEYVIKTLKWHLKEVKKVEQNLEESRQANMMVQDMIVIDEPESSTEGHD